MASMALADAFQLSLSLGRHRPIINVMVTQANKGALYTFMSALMSHKLCMRRSIIENPDNRVV